MDTTYVIASIIGIYLIVSGLFLLFRGKTLPLLLKDFFSHRSTTHLAGALLVFVGGYMVTTHNLWGTSWEILVSILGWLVLLKGALYVLAPEIFTRIHISKTFRYIWGILSLIAGVLLVTA